MTVPRPRSTAAPGFMRDFALFSYGFRPFFLLSGIYAALAVPLWLWIYVRGSTAVSPLPPHLWHGHEMIYGFVLAAIAGFLLTAVPSWTSSRGFAGWPLISLVLLWLAGRVAMAAASDLPAWVTWIAELAFLPALAALLTPPLLRARNRNTPMLLVLAVLWLADAAFVIAMRSGNSAHAASALRFAIDVVLILVTIIGGRIVPAFTANALRRHGRTMAVVAPPWLEPVVIALMVSIAVVDVLWPDSFASGTLAALAAAAHVLRLSGWRSRWTLREPIVWILHAGYAWLPIGLALKALWLLGAVPWSARWLHAFTLGVFGTMILAVMTRAALGHTGRPLVVSRAVVVSYVLLIASVLVRVFGPALCTHDYVLTVIAAGLLWTLAFVLFVIVYAPILWRVRVDGAGAEK